MKCNSIIPFTPGSCVVPVNHKPKQFHSMNTFWLSYLAGIQKHKSKKAFAISHWNYLTKSCAVCALAKSRNSHGKQKCCRVTTPVVRPRIIWFMCVSSWVVNYFTVFPCVLISEIKGSTLNRKVTANIESYSIAYLGWAAVSIITIHIKTHKGLSSWLPSQELRQDNQAQTQGRCKWQV